MLASFTRPTLVEVVTPRCVECRAMRPDLDAVAAQHRSVDLVVLDAKEHEDAVAELRVLGTPTLIAVRDGQEVARFVGRRTRAELDQIFQSVASGDLGDVPRIGKGDKLVWSVAGVALAIAGLAMGPQWVVVGIGAGLFAYAIIR